MFKEFHFETIDGRHLLVEINIFCTSRDGDFGWEDLSMLDDSSQPVEFESLSKADQSRLENDCDNMAYHYSDEALQDYQESAADALYDSWKDGTFG